MARAFLFAVAAWRSMDLGSSIRSDTSDLMVLDEAAADAAHTAPGRDASDSVFHDALSERQAPSLGSTSKSPWNSWSAVKSKITPKIGEESKVDYGKLASGGVSIAGTVVDLVGKKIPFSPLQKQVVDGTAKIAQGVGAVIKTICPFFGPAAPVVAGAGCLLSFLGGSVSAMTARKDRFDELGEGVRRGFSMMDLKLDALAAATQKMQQQIRDMTESLSSQLNKIERRLASMQHQLVNLYMKETRQDIQTIHRRHQTLLEYILNKHGDDPTLFMLKQNLAEDLKRYDNLRSGFRQSMATWVSCPICGGKAAAALWFQHVATARMEIFSILYFFYLKTGELEYAAKLQRDLTQDLGEMQGIIENLALKLWLLLPLEELQKHLQITAADLVEEETLVEKLSKITQRGQTMEELEVVKQLYSLSTRAPAVAALAVPMLITHLHTVDSSAEPRVMLRKASDHLCLESSSAEYGEKTCAIWKECDSNEWRQWFASRIVDWPLEKQIGLHPRSNGDKVAYCHDFSAHSCISGWCGLEALASSEVENDVWNGKPESTGADFAIRAALRPESEHVRLQVPDAIRCQYVAMALKQIGFPAAYEVAEKMELFAKTILQPASERYTKSVAAWGDPQGLGPYRYCAHEAHAAAKALRKQHESFTSM